MVGHAHLQVGEPQRGLGFYRDALGFKLTMFMPGAAAFVSAGGYRHHLGFNVWRGAGVPPVPEGRVGLRHWKVVLEDPKDVAAVGIRVRAAGVAAGGDREGWLLVRDPWGMAVRFVGPEGPTA